MVHPNGREGKGLHGRWAADMVVGGLCRVRIEEWVWMRLRDPGLGILAPPWHVLREIKLTITVIIVVTYWVHGECQAL